MQSKVKPLDLANVIRDAFLAGAGMNTASKEIERIPDDILSRLNNYDPEHVPAFHRLSALHSEAVREKTVTGDLGEIRRRVRNIWGAISSNQVVDKDVEGQAKRLLDYVDEIRCAPSPSPDTTAANPVQAVAVKAQCCSAISPCPWQRHNGMDDVCPTCAAASLSQPNGRAVVTRWLVEETLSSGTVRWKAFEHEHAAHLYANEQSDGPCTVTPLYRHPPQPEQPQHRLELALAFVARMCWRTDPPNASAPFTTDQRFEAIKHHPTIKHYGKPHIELAEREAGE